MSLEIPRFDVLPDFRRGFGFSWSVATTIGDALPWTFTVEVAETQGGPWSIHAGPAQNVSFLRGEGPILSPAAPALFFRLRMQTADRDVYSDVRVPAQQLQRREWLAARTMMRDASLQYRGPGGVRMALWQRALYGPSCVCANEITGESENTRCLICHGTGKQLGYIGPVEIHGIMETRKVQARQDDDTALTEAEPNQIETLAAPLLRAFDVLVDTGTGRRYIVGAVQHLAAVRGVPVLVRAQLAMPSTSSPIYNVGDAA